MQDIENLRWCIGSTPLLYPDAIEDAVVFDRAWCNEQLRRHEDWFNSLMLSPGQVAAEVDDPAAGRIPLGKRFERYLHYWFTHSPHFKLKAANVQVSDGQYTTGEFDFVVEEVESEEVYHVEVACKFYLGATNKRDQSQWIGPSGRDRLDLKTSTLQRQIRLAETPEGRAALEALGIQEVIPRILIKGYFFHHFRNLMTFKQPFGAHPKHHAGWWAREREIDRLFAGDGTWMLLPKSDWLASIHVDVPDERLFSSRRMPKACRNYIAEHGRAVMVAQLDMVDGRWVELSRGCVVTDRWPRIG